LLICDFFLFITSYFLLKRLHQLPSNVGMLIISFPKCPKRLYTVHISLRRFVFHEQDTSCSIPRCDRVDLTVASKTFKPGVLKPGRVAPPGVYLEFLSRNSCRQMAEAVCTWLRMRGCVHCARPGLNSWLRPASYRWRWCAAVQDSVLLKFWHHVWRVVEVLLILCTILLNTATKDLLRYTAQNLEMTGT